MPYLALAALLALCLVRGLWFVHGMTVPPDDDITRDLGFIQGMRDGNLFGDPAYGGEFRWYPPLLHALAALSAGLAGVSDAAFMPLWIAVGPWLGLLTPLSFFLMNQRLLGPWSAAAATAVLVLYNGAALPGDAAVSYTALTLTPMLAWPMFFFGVRLIQGRAGSARLRDALLLGSWIGLAFLAHTVPAVLLACIVTTVAFATRGIAFRTLLWLSVAALAALAWSLLFLGPLLVSYRLHIVNTVPGEWLHTLMAVPIRKWLIAANLPGIAAIAVVWWLRRYGPLSRVAVAILGSWILVCAAFLLRHYACGYAGRTGGACGVFVLVIHHFEAYLMAAFACLAGHAIVLVGRWSRDAAPAWRRPLMAAGMLAAAAGMAGFLMQPWDLQKRRLALTTPEALFDLEAYRWILANTAPVDLFVTGLADPADPGSATVDPGTAVVMAAGRRLVAAPAVFSNPYVDWEARQARRLAYLESLDGTGDPARLCELAAEAGGGAAAYLLLPAGHAAGTDRVTPVLRTAGTILYRVAPCPAASRASPAETPAG